MFESHLRKRQYLVSAMFSSRDRFSLSSLCRDLFCARDNAACGFVTAICLPVLCAARVSVFQPFSVFRTAAALSRTSAGAFPGDGGEKSNCRLHHRPPGHGETYRGSNRAIRGDGNATPRDFAAGVSRRRCEGSRQAVFCSPCLVQGVFLLGGSRNSLCTLQNWQCESCWRNFPYSRRAELERRKRGSVRMCPGVQIVCVINVLFSSDGPCPSVVSILDFQDLTTRESCFRRNVGDVASTLNVSLCFALV